MARVAIICTLAVLALLAAPSLGAFNVMNGDLTSASGWNYLASFCFEAGGFFAWDVYTGGIPEEQGITLYVYDQSGWTSASGQNMNCKDRILYATDSYDVRDNVVNNRTFSTRGDEYFVLANCVLTEGYYVQYHINATNTCDY